MALESGEVDFNTEIVSGENGEFTIESIEEPIEEEIETEVGTEVETEVEEEIEEKIETKVETETEIETKTETKIEAESFEPFEAVVNGESMSIDSAEEAQKIINNLGKPQQKQSDTWEQAQKELGVTTKDLALISAVKGGDKDAMLFLAKEAGIDLSQLIYDEAPESFDKDFTPTVETEGQRVMGDIEASGEMKDFSAMIDTTDQNFIENLGDVKNLNAFRAQVASGKAAELMPLAKKMSAVENIPLFEAYAKVGHAQKTATSEKKVEKETTKKTPPAKKATPAGKEAPKGEQTAEDIWDMDDDAFMKEHGQRKI